MSSSSVLSPSFLSTPSARRATGRSCVGLGSPCNFYPRPPRGGRHRRLREHFVRRIISIHALREEGDRAHDAGRDQREHFYPRPPRGGRPGDVLQLGAVTIISIHALREEGDWQIVCRFGQSLQFLSTPSARRATIAFIVFGCLADISIHALREEGDPARLSEVPEDSLYFYPRPPRGGRLAVILALTHRL